MSLWRRFFGKKRIRSAVLIDLGSYTVGGAVVCAQEGAQPTILYATRVVIKAHAGEAPLAAMGRALGTLSETLQKEGSPLLLRKTGNGHPDELFISLDAPWQETVLHSEDIEKSGSFIFSRRMVEEALRRESKTPLGAVLADESVVGTILNGYETARPYGKRATRARILVLASYIAQEAADAVSSALRGAYHRRSVQLIAGASMRTQALRAAFPLERDALVIDAAGFEISIALIRRGLLTAVEEAADGRLESKKWVEEVTARLRALAGRYPLPRVVFILAPSGDEENAVAKRLSALPFRELWLSENPPKVLPLAPAHLRSLVNMPSEASADLLLGLMTVFWSRRSAELYPLPELLGY